MSYSLRTNYTNNVTNSTLRADTNPYGSAITTRVVTGTQAGAYLYNVAYLHPDSGYEFTSVGDISFVLDGVPYTNGSGVIGAYIQSGLIIIQTVKLNPNNIYALTINGAATLQSEPTPSESTPISVGGVASNPSLGVGNFYNFNQYNNIQIKHKQNFNILNKVDNWAVSFWANIPPSQSLAGVGTQTIIQKRNVQTYFDANGIERTQTNNLPNYPFDFSVYTELHPASPGHVFVRASDGISTLNISSSTAVNDGTFHHYALNKVGNELALYIDGVKDVSGSYSFAELVSNDNDIVIGSDTISPGGLGFSGSIAQFRLHRNELSSSVISSLSNNSTSGSALQRKEVGYVFYKHGMVVVTDPRPRYQNMFLGNGDFDYTNKGFELNYKATKQIEEVSILCEINRDEYNVSSNPSLKVTYDENEPRLKSMVTGSDFRPYITQVGLYNDFGDLLAVAKLGSPLKKRQDVDVTINVKFDLD